MSSDNQVETSRGRTGSSDRLGQLQVLLALLLFATLVLLELTVFRANWRELSRVLAAEFAAACVIFSVAYLLVRRYESRIALWRARKSPDEALAVIGDVLALHVSSDVGKSVADNAIQPLLRPGFSDSIERRDLTYDITLDRRDLPFTKKSDVDGHYLAKTVLSCVRRLPLESDVWFSFARTVEALEREFEDARCIQRELTPLESIVWESAITESWFDVEIHIEPNITVTTTRVERVDADLVRFYVHLPRNTPGPVRITQKVTFLLPPGTVSFPVRFSRYLCVGRSAVTFELVDPDVSHVTPYVNFAGDADLDLKAELMMTDSSGPVHRIRIVTSERALLWPGSGITFVWR